MTGNPLQFLFRFLFTLGGLFFGPVGGGLGFALGWLSDFFILKKKFFVRAEISLIPSLFFFLGNWAKYNNRDFRTTVKIINQVIEDRLVLQKWDLDLAKKNFLLGFEPSASKKSIFEAAQKIYPGFPLNMGLRTQILEACLAINEGFITEDIRELSKNFGFEIDPFEEPPQWEKRPPTKVDSDIPWALGILGVSAKSTSEEIKSAYRKKALAFHPDRLKNTDPKDLENFHQIQKAYEILKSKEVQK